MSSIHYYEGGSYLYGLYVNGITTSSVPSLEAFSPLFYQKKTLTLSTSALVTSIVAHQQNSGTTISSFLTKLEFFMSDGTSQVAIAPKYLPSDFKYTLLLPAFSHRLSLAGSKRLVMERASLITLLLLSR